MTSLNQNTETNDRSLDEQETGLEGSDNSPPETLNTSPEESEKNPQTPDGVLDDPELESPQDQQEAKTKGHKSYEQWIQEGRDPKLYKNATQFNQYAKDYKNSLKKLESELHHVRLQNQELINNYKHTVEQAVIRARIELEQQLTQAELAGDVRAVKTLATQKAQLDLQNTTAQADFSRSQAELIRNERMTIDQAFFQRNRDWFNDENPQLKDEAMRIKERLWTENPTANYATVARDIEAEIRWKHRLPSSQFNELATTTPHLPSAQSNVNKFLKTGTSKLNREQEIEFKAVKNSLKRQGIDYTEADYFKALAKN